MSGLERPSRRALFAAIILFACSAQEPARTVDVFAGEARPANPRMRELVAAELGCDPCAEVDGWGLTLLVSDEPRFSFSTEEVRSLRIDTESADRLEGQAALGIELDDAALARLRKVEDPSGPVAVARVDGEIVGFGVFYALDSFFVLGPYPTVAAAEAARARLGAAGPER